MQGHARLATIAAPTATEAANLLRSLTDAVDAVEVRLDSFWHHVPSEEQATDDLVALLDASRHPLVATLRPRRQGGRFEGDEQVRLGLLATAARAGFSAIDVEGDVGATPGLASSLAEGAEVVLSQHEPATPSCEDGGRALLVMQDRGAAVHKLAFPSGSFADELRALELCRKHALRGGRPAIVPVGAQAPMRALLALAGNVATYGHAANSMPATSGQPALDDVAATWRHWGLEKADLDERAGTASPWLAVAGTPIGHSLSPRIHNAALRRAGRKERFGAVEVPASASALRLLCMVASRIGLAGASVTSPHKTDAIRMGTADAVAKAVGAANCLRFDAAEPHATNTDATALRRILERHVDAGAPAVVLGSGGAARASAWALRELGAQVRFTSRDVARARRFSMDLGVPWTPWDERGDLAAQVWVQAARLPPGPSPIAPSQLRGRPLVVELDYATGTTPMQEAAREAGCEVVGGRTVLVEQAVDAYRFWFQDEPDATAMREAAS